MFLCHLTTYHVLNLIYNFLYHDGEFVKIGNLRYARQLLLYYHGDTLVGFSFCDRRRHLRKPKVNPGFTDLPTNN